MIAAIIILGFVISILTLVLKDIKVKWVSLAFKIFLILIFIALAIMQLIKSKNDSAESFLMKNTTLSIEENISELDSNINAELTTLEIHLKNISAMNDSLAILGKSTTQILQNRERSLIDYEKTTQTLEGQYRTEFTTYRNTIRNDFRIKDRMKKRNSTLKQSRDSLLVASNYLRNQVDFLMNRVELSYFDSSKLEMMELDAWANFYKSNADSSVILIKRLNQKIQENKQRIDTLNSDELLMEFKMMFLLDDLRDSIWKSNFELRTID